MRIITLEVIHLQCTSIIYFYYEIHFFFATSIGHSFYFIADKYINNEIIAKDI